MRLISYLTEYVEGRFEDDMARFDFWATLVVWAVMIVAGAYLIWMVV
jgi:hypothetical protein